MIVNLAQPATRGLSVVVASCADAERAVRCVRSVLDTHHETLDVIVVENRPARSRTRAALAAAFPHDSRVRLIEAWQPGLAHARNRGLEAAQEEIVAFVDDDVVVDRRWASTVAEAFSDPEVDCVTGLISPMSLEKRSEQLFEQFAGFGKGSVPRSYRLARSPDHGPLFPYAAGAFGSGSNTALRATVARRLGGFDEMLGAGTAARGGEDLDIYIRLLQGGHRLDYEPGAVVFHQHPTDPAALRDRAFSYGIGLTAMLTRQLLRGPRLRLLRASPAGVRYLLNPNSRKNKARTAGYPRRLTALELLGMLAGPFALARSALQARRLQPSPAGEAPGFTPGATGAIDLDRPLGDLDPRSTPAGGRYGTFLALVRLHGDPLAIVELPLRDGGLSAAELSERLWNATSAEIEAHGRAHGCLPAAPLSAATLRDGLGTVAACPRGLPARARAPHASVIVPTAGRPERIRTCLGSLAALDYPSYEIVIVDNVPDDPRTRETVRECAEEVREATGGRVSVRYLAEPLPGSSVARNRGIREIDSELIAFTDDDVTVDPDWLWWMLVPFLKDERVGVVTGLVMPARLDTPEQRRFEELSGFGKGLCARRYDTGANFAHDRLLYPYWGAVFGSGNSMAFRRAVIEQAGGFDPALGAGSPARAGADIESFSHAILRGHRLAYEPRAVCWHDHRASETALRQQTFNYGVGCTAILTKWCLRDRRLISSIARRMISGIHKRRDGVPNASSSSPELLRLKAQLAIHRQSGMLIRQFVGFAAGPFMYLFSLHWTRRQRLRDVLPTSRKRHA